MDILKIFKYIKIKQLIKFKKSKKNPMQWALNVLYTLAFRWIENVSNVS